MYYGNNIQNHSAQGAHRWAFACMCACNVQPHGLLYQD